MGDNTVDGLLAKCGFRCDLCPAYTGNIKNDEDRSAVSRGWERLFGFDIPPDKVECVGCQNEGRHADTECPVRPCALEKGIENCALCDSFACDALKTRTNFLDDYLKSAADLSDEDYVFFVKPYDSRKRLNRIRERREADE